MLLCRGVSLLLRGCFGFSCSVHSALAALFVWLFVVHGRYYSWDVMFFLMLTVANVVSGVRRESIDACNNYYRRFDGCIYKSMILLRSVPVCSSPGCQSRTTLCVWRGVPVKLFRIKKSVRADAKQILNFPLLLCTAYGIPGIFRCPHQERIHLIRKQPTSIWIKIEKFVQILSIKSMAINSRTVDSIRNVGDGRGAKWINRQTTGTQTKIKRSLVPH